ncbi:hypothetical protein [Edaphobacter aggregans]|uniref:hypothetical protein n=1 Tax=Edaphobacter aggregans TaxID=570835 RepID=UPI000557EA60|nr:hypothetical protein [Edaphobacter aggregans]
MQRDSPEVGLDGRIVDHRVRKSAYVHERLHSMSGPQKLPDELYDAAEKFRMDSNVQAWPAGVPGLLCASD